MDRIGSRVNELADDGRMHVAVARGLWDQRGEKLGHGHGQHGVERTCMVSVLSDSVSRLTIC